MYGMTFTAAGSTSLERVELERVEPAPVPLQCGTGDTVAVSLVRGTGERVEWHGRLERERYGVWGTVHTVQGHAVHVRLIEGAGVRVLQRVELEGVDR